MTAASLSGEGSLAPLCGCKHRGGSWGQEGHTRLLQKGLYPLLALSVWQPAGASTLPWDQTSQGIKKLTFEELQILEPRDAIVSFHKARPWKEISLPALCHPYQSSRFTAISSLSTVNPMWRNKRNGRGLWDRYHLCNGQIQVAKLSFGLVPSSNP